MKKFQLKIFRILVLTGLFIILLQIYLLPQQKAYMDLALLEQVDNTWQIASSANIENNITIIYPFVRNVMNQIVMIRLQVYGLEFAPISDIYFTKNNKLETNSPTTWVVGPDKAAKTIDFTSHWEINSWIVYNITKTIKFIVLVMQTYLNQIWETYSWVSLIIK